MDLRRSRRGEKGSEVVVLTGRKSLFRLDRWASCGNVGTESLGRDMRPLVGGKASRDTEGSKVADGQNTARTGARDGRTHVLLPAGGALPRVRRERQDRPARQRTTLKTRQRTTLKT